MTLIRTTAIGELLASHADEFDLAYFYCSFSDDESLHTQNILGSVLAQVCSDSIYHEARAKYAELSKQALSKTARLDADVLVDLIIKQARQRGHLFIVVDGINECSDPQGVLEYFERILKGAPRVQLLVSSIYEKGIENSMNRMPRPFDMIISPKTINDDVRLHVKSALTTHPRLRQLPQSLKDEIVLKLTNGAAGM